MATSADQQRLELSAAVKWACLLEASAEKLGNVHPRAEFSDLTYSGFVRSANAVAPVLARVADLGVGRAVFEAIQATRLVVPSNTNLGIVLLLAPLTAVPIEDQLRDRIGDVLKQLTREDASWVYRAIRLAQPGGLGQVSENDVANEPSGTLLEVMSSAADRDGIAAQYANNFSWVLLEGVPFLAQCANYNENWNEVIVRMQLQLLANHLDTLIVRKCGIATAEQATRQASDILRESTSQPLFKRESVQQFDRWLRADGNRRNPGTTADLVTACLFAALRDGLISPPHRDPDVFSAERLALARAVPTST